MKPFKNTLDVFFPNTCPGCGSIISKDDFLCDFCLEMFSTRNSENRCKLCGKKLYECSCKNRKLNFVSCVSPYNNVGLAKQAMHDFKFRRHLKNAELFAHKMAITVKCEYRKIDFDGICYVPMSRRKELKRGYNQSRIIALKLSKILNIPLYDNMLYCNYSIVSQHDLPLKERFGNVKGLYGYRHRNCGDTMLLVDDITTSGATLDECARQLLLSGCDKVYCVTALSSLQKK